LKILNSENGKTAILNDGDILEVKTLKGNPLTIQIKCEDGVLFVDEITEHRIKELKIEQEQKEIMEDLQKKNA